MISGFGWAALALLFGYLALFFWGSALAAQAAGRPVWLFARATGTRPTGRHGVPRGLCARLLRAAPLARRAHAPQGRPALDRGARRPPWPDRGLCRGAWRDGGLCRADVDGIILARRRGRRRNRRSGLAAGSTGSAATRRLSGKRHCWQVLRWRFPLSRPSSPQSCFSGRPARKCGPKRPPCARQSGRTMIVTPRRSHAGSASRARP